VKKKKNESKTKKGAIRLVKAAADRLADKKAAVKETENKTEAAQASRCAAATTATAGSGSRAGQKER